jgi:hypothetical protein
MCRVTTRLWIYSWGRTIETPTAQKKQKAERPMWPKLTKVDIGGVKANPSIGHTKSTNTTNPTSAKIKANNFFIVNPFKN